MRWTLMISILLWTAVALAQEIPQGTALPVMLSTTINAAKNKPDQTIAARIMQDVPLSSGSYIPAKTQVTGRVLEAVKSGAGTGSRVVVSFDRVVIKGQQVPVTTSLRAIASVSAVNQARLPTSATDRGASPASWTTLQVGGDVAYRGGGHVMSGNTVVGEPVAYDGATGELITTPGSDCVHVPAKTRTQALWVFSSSVCGVYGFNELTIAHHGDNDPVGRIEFDDATDVNIPAGSGLLLIVMQPEK